MNAGTNSWGYPSRKGLVIEAGKTCRESGRGCQESGCTTEPFGPSHRNPSMISRQRTRTLPTNPGRKCVIELTECLLGLARPSPFPRSSRASGDLARPAGRPAPAASPPSALHAAARGCTDHLVADLGQHPVQELDQPFLLDQQRTFLGKQCADRLRQRLTACGSSPSSFHSRLPWCWRVCGGRTRLLRRQRSIIDETGKAGLT